MNGINYKIYLAGSGLQLNHTLATYLQTYGWSVKSFVKYNEAIRHINDNPDLWIIDYIYPLDKHDSLLKKIKAINNCTPVMLIFGPNVAFNELIELETAYDDYVVKPFSAFELIMRAQKLIENRKRKKPEFSKVIYYNGYEINIVERLVHCKGKTINLTTKEFELVYLLVSNLKRPFSKEQLIRYIWADDFSVSDRAVYDLIRRARSKLRALKITTVYGYGYKVN